jgi:hypothetical protein
MNGNYTGATLNVVLSVAACLVGTVLGISLGRIIQ